MYCIYIWGKIELFLCCMFADGGRGMLQVLRFYNGWFKTICSVYTYISIYIYIQIYTCIYVYGGRL